MPNKTHNTCDCIGFTQSTEYFNIKLTYEQPTASTSQQNTDRARLTTNVLRPQPVDVETIVQVTRTFSRPLITPLWSRVFPSLWKHDRITSISKSGDLDAVVNYRPLTLVLEENVANQLMGFLEDNNLFPETRPGFRNRLPNKPALLQIADDIYNNIVHIVRSF